MSVTPKEKKVLQLLAVGMSSKQIAKELTISFHTVESHRKAVGTQQRKCRNRGL